MSSFDEKIEQYFPNAISVPVFLDRVNKAIGSNRFTPFHSLFGLKVCRDDNNRELRLAILQNYPAGYFALDSLAAIGNSAGQTGYGAASHHIPTSEGYGALVLLSLPHIGISEDGQIGKVERVLRDGLGANCGALCAYVSAIENNPRASWGENDPEMGMIEKAMNPHVQDILRGNGSEEHLVAATYKALEIAAGQQIESAGHLMDHLKGHPIFHIGGIIINSAKGMYIHQVGPIDYMPARR